MSLKFRKEVAKILESGRWFSVREIEIAYGKPVKENQVYAALKAMAKMNEVVEVSVDKGQAETHSVCYALAPKFYIKDSNSREVAELKFAVAEMAAKLEKVK